MAAARGPAVALLLSLSFFSPLICVQSELPDLPDYDGKDLSSCSDYKAVKTIRAPDDKRYRRAEWMEWQAMHKDITKAWGDKIEVVFLGDSLTLKWNEHPSAFWCNSYSDNGECRSDIRPIFDQRFGWKYNAVALGVAGDSTLHLLHRLQEGELSGVKPKLVVLNIGTNDLSTYWDRETIKAGGRKLEDIADSVFRAIQQIIIQIKQISCDIFVLVEGILPRGDGLEPCEECFEDYKPVIEMINERIADFVKDASQVAFVNCGETFLTKGDKIDEDLMPDLIHPGNEGYEVFAECLAEKIEKISVMKALDPSESHMFNFFFGEDIDSREPQRPVTIEQLYTAAQLEAGSCSKDGTGVCYSLQDVVFEDESRKDCEDWRDAEVPMGQFDYRDRRATWQALHQSFQHTMQDLGDNIHVILYGDTVLHDLDTEHYSSMEKHLLRKYNTVSFGIPGDTSRNLLRRLQQGETDGMTASAAVLHSGPFDLTKYYPPSVVIGVAGNKFQDFVASRIANALEASAAAIKQENCDTFVLIVGLLPRGNTYGDCTTCTDNYAYVINAINQQLEGFASRSSGVGFVDCGGGLLRSNGNLDPDYVQDDGTTLTLEGSDIFASCVAKELDGVAGLWDIPYSDIWENKVTFEDLLTEEQREARCPDTVDGICYSWARDISGYEGQELVSCESKRGLYVAEGVADGRDGEEEWMHLHNAHKTIAERNGDKIEVLFFGDGQVAQLAEPSFQEDFDHIISSKYNAVPFGIKGDTSHSALWRLQNGEIQQLSELRMAAVSLGSEDIVRYVPRDILEQKPGQSIDDFRYKLGIAAKRVSTSVEAVVLQLLKDNCNLHVILTTINPRGDGPYSEIIAAVNENLNAFGGSQVIKGLDFLDCATRFSSGPDSLPNLDLYERDEVTLNHKGVAEMGLCIDDLLRDMESLREFQPLRRNFYAEARKTALFADVDAAIAALEPLEGSHESCDSWKDLGDLEAGSTAGRKAMDKEWRNDHRRYVQTVEDFGNKVHLVFYGDENTLRWNGEASDDFEQQYAFKYNALALGKTGDTSLNLLWRLEDGELGSKHAGFAPDVAVLLIGVHDFLNYVHPEVLDGRRGDWALQEAAEAVANSIVRIAARIKQESCETHVTILGILPRGDPSGSKRWGIFEDITRATNRNVQKWTQDAEGVSFVDCTDHFLDGDGRPDTDLMERDLTVLTREGFEELSKCLEEPLADKLPEYPDRLNTNLIFAEKDDIDNISPEMSRLFSAEDLTLPCSQESDETCYRPAVFQLPLNVPGDVGDCTAFITIPKGRDDGRSFSSSWLADRDRNRQVFLRIGQISHQVQLLVIGDQNVKRWNDKDGRGLFENFFVGPFGSIAAGIPGDTALNLLWRVQNGELANFKPRVTVIMAGINDLTRYFPPSATGRTDEKSHTTIAEWVVNATAATVAEIKRRDCNTHVVVVGLLPRSSSPQCKECGWPHYRPHVEEINKRIHDMWSSNSGISTVDCSHALMNDKGWLHPGNIEDDGSTLTTGGLGRVSKCLYDHLASETLMEIRWGVQRLQMYNYYFNEPMLPVDERLRLPAPPEEPPAPDSLGEAEAGTNYPDADIRPDSIGILTVAELELPCSPERCYKDNRVSGVQGPIEGCRGWEDAAPADGDNDGKIAALSYKLLHEGFLEAMQESRSSTIDWVVYGDDSVAAMKDVAGSDGLGARHGVLLGIDGDTADNVLWRVNNGEGFRERDPKPRSSYILAGVNDLLTYFPPRVTWISEDSPEAFAIAQRVANVTQSIVASLKQQSCSTRVVVVGLLSGFVPQQEVSALLDLLPLVDIVNGMLKDWTADTSGAEFLDCSSGQVSATSERDEEAARKLMDCILADVEKHEPSQLSSPSPSPPASPVRKSPESAEDDSEETGADLSKALVDLFSKEDLEAGCHEGGMCYVTGAREMKIPQLPEGAHDCTAWQRARRNFPSGSSDGKDLDSAWMARHRANGQRLKGSTAEAVIYGGTEVEMLSRWLSTPQAAEQFDGGVTVEGLSIAGDSTDNLLWRLQRGETLGLKRQTGVVFISPEDILRYFPESVYSSNNADVLQLAAQRVVNATLACVGEIKVASCTATEGSSASHVVVVGALPLDSKTADITREISSQLQAAASVIGGVEYLDCSRALGPSSSKAVPALALPGVLDIDALEHTAACLHAHLLQLSISQPRKQDDAEQGDGPALVATDWHLAGWSNCSNTCGGWQQRAVVCKGFLANGQEVIVSNYECDEATMPEPKARACNAAEPCRPAYWVAEPWSQCSTTCGLGFSTRTSKCMDAYGEVEEELCASRDPPSGLQDCKVEECDFCKQGNNTCSGHGICANETCVCDEGYKGVMCQAPETCPRDVLVDNGFGRCCSSGLMDTEGSCCGEWELKDSHGSCCAPGLMDACGKCNGNGIAVDVLGNCCIGDLDATGTCCENRLVDECGLCGGDNSSCAIVGTVKANLRAAIETPAGQVPERKLSCEVLTRSFEASMARALKRLGVSQSRIKATVVEVSGVEEAEECVQAGKGSAHAAADGPPIKTRRLLQNVFDGAGSSLSIAYTILPKSETDPSGSQGDDFSVSEVRQLLSNGVSFDAGSSYTSGVLSLQTLGREGICGNGLCEVGEASASMLEKKGGSGATRVVWSSRVFGDCPQDCPERPALPCPEDSAGRTCGNRGVCVALIGACQCHRGFAGPDCRSCSPGHVAEGSDCIPEEVFERLSDPSPGLMARMESYHFPLWTIVATAAAGLFIILVAAGIAFVLISRKQRRAALRHKHYFGGSTPSSGRPESGGSSLSASTRACINAMFQHASDFRGADTANSGRSAQNSARRSRNRDQALEQPQQHPGQDSTGMMHKNEALDYQEANNPLAYMMSPRQHGNPGNMVNGSTDNSGTSFPDFSTSASPVPAVSQQLPSSYPNSPSSLVDGVGGDLTDSMVMAAVSTATGVLSDGVPDQLHKAMQNHDDTEPVHGFWSGSFKDAFLPSSHGSERSAQERQLSDEYGLELLGDEALPRGFSARQAEVLEEGGAKTARL